MKCFNDDLPRHQEFCGTKAIYSEPSKSDFGLPNPKLKNIVRDVSEAKCEIVSPDIPKTPKKQKSFKKEKVKKDKSFSSEEGKDKKEKKDKKKKKKKDKDKKKSKKDLDSSQMSLQSFDIEVGAAEETNDKARSQRLDDDDELYSSEEEWEESHVTKTVSVTKRIDQRKANKAVGGQVEDDIDIGDNDSYGPIAEDQTHENEEKKYKIKIMEGSVPDFGHFEPETVNLRHVMMTPGSRNPHTLPTVDLKVTSQRAMKEFVSSGIQHINLNNTETQEKRDYDWEQPDWVNPSLRPTEIGEHIKVVGDIREVNSDGHSPVLRTQHTWEKPEWAQKNILKPTGKMELLKQGFDALRTPLRISGSAGTRMVTLSKDDTVALEKQLLASTELLEEKVISWEKPKWATENPLRKTGILDQIVKVDHASNLRSTPLSPVKQQPHGQHE